MPDKLSSLETKLFPNCSAYSSVSDYSHSYINLNPFSKLNLIYNHWYQCTENACPSEEI